MLHLKQKLKFLQREIKVTLEEVYATDISGGYRFIHDDSKLLIFLRPIIENIRKGNTAQIIQAEFCKAPYNNERVDHHKGRGTDRHNHKQAKKHNHYTHI